MRKNITNILQKGNIKPKDRVKLLVMDMASKERDGKELLTEADRHALSEGWTPENNQEVKEYTRFNEGWKNTAYAEMDAQTTYLTATNSFLRASKCVSYILYKNYIKEGIADRAFDLLLEKDKRGEALNIALNYLGLELDYTIYLYAFKLAGEELQKSLVALYPDAETAPDYLNQEEIIFNLFEGKDRLTQEAKDKLAELITDECYDKHFSEWSFSKYFADIPLIEVAKKAADNYKITYKEVKAGTEAKLNKELTTKLTAYAKENKRDIKDIIKETILKWLDKDLLDKYTPLFMSEEKATYNEQDTKLTNKEVFKKWLEVKAKATETIQGLIEKGKLKTAKKTKELKLIKTLVEKSAKEMRQTKQDTPITKTKTIITGKSLYNIKGDYQFIKDFKNQADDFKIFGDLVLFLRGCSFVREYATLLGFLELFKALSKTFDTDLTYSIKNWINRFKDDLELFKREIIFFATYVKEKSYQRVFYLADDYLEELLDVAFDPDKVKADLDGRIKIYYTKIKNQLEDDFTIPYYEQEK